MVDPQRDARRQIVTILSAVSLLVGAAIAWGIHKVAVAIRIKRR